MEQVEDNGGCHSCQGWNSGQALVHAMLKLRRCSGSGGPPSMLGPGLRVRSWSDPFDVLARNEYAIQEIHAHVSRVRSASISIF